MRDRGAIYAGLVIFLGLITFPLWHNFSSGASSKGPEAKILTTERQCVAPKAYMKTSHMDLLIDWRERLRDGQRTYTTADGRTYDISLTGTCLKQCHQSKEEFCDRCHNYAVSSTYCWDCHIDPKQAVVASVR
jgi:hypothetical protein